MAKHTPLVCQYLENISVDALAKYQEIIRAYTRGRQGVYALYRRGKLYYVGLASNLRGRLRQHLRDRHGNSWDRFSVYLTIGDHHLRELESLLLRIVRPGGNKQRGKFHRTCENLGRRFKRDIRQLQRMELDGLFGILSAGKKTSVSSADAGRIPPLRGVISGPMKLRAKFKKTLVRARVRRDGRIRYAGRVYNSPSLAAAAACRRGTCNGWTFWEFERAPGDWIKLRELRR